MKLVVGLGNPGDEYVGTRHNVGYDVVDRLAARHGVSLDREKRLKAKVGKTRIGEDPVWLVEPLSFMNLCGPVVARVVRERDVPLGDVLVIYDDFNLPLGKLRLRRSGAAGGHNGLRSLIAHLGQEFPRLRIGIGEPPPGYAERFVLTRFKPAERKCVEETLDRAVDCAEDWCTLGPEAAMNRYNA